MLVHNDIAAMRACDEREAKPLKLSGYDCVIPGTPHLRGEGLGVEDRGGRWETVAANGKGGSWIVGECNVSSDHGRHCAFEAFQAVPMSIFVYSNFDGQYL
jgi:hypothetical protein